MRRSLLILMTTAALSGCALSITDRTPATLTRTTTAVYDVEADASATGYTVSGVTAYVQGDPFPMTNVSGNRWRVSAPLNPCRNTFSLSFTAQGTSRFGSASVREPRTGDLQKWISGNPPATCPATFGATYSVNGFNDAVDTSPGDGVCQTAARLCSLRAAVMEANAHAGADQILVPAGVYNLTLVGEDATAAAGDLDITDTVTITGATAPDGTGVTVQADAALNDRVLDVHAGAGATPTVATLTGLELRNGRAGLGGGLRNAAVTVFTDGIITNNVGSTAAGGIHNTGTLTLRRAVIKENRTELATGAGVRQDSGSLLVEDSAFTDNHSNQHGGAMSIVAGEVSLFNVTLHGNRADTYGGAIHANPAALFKIRNTTITGNRADADGSGFGGGGGILRTGAAENFTVSNTIIAENTTNGQQDDCSGATFFSWDYNLIGVTDGCTIEGAVANTLTGARPSALDPRLGALGIGVGTTPTRVPTLTSPARDAGNPSAPSAAGVIVCLPSDQRGRPRPNDGNSDGTARCDIGAVEAG